MLPLHFSSLAPTQAGRRLAPTASPAHIICRSSNFVPGSLLDGKDGLLIPGGSQNSRPNKPPPKLVLPGKQGPPSTGGGGRLIIPEQGTEKILAQGAQALGPELTTITGPNRYRPPAGFMNEDSSPETMETVKASPEEMISRLRARAGRWHTLAKLLPALAIAHYNSSAVDELTGITPLEQSRWITASTVYDSLVQSGKMSEEALEHFDQRGDELLEPFRFLTQDMRVEAAQYIIEKNLDPPECEVLARAMKEWERRPKERTGFSNLPADCMSFKHLRDAGECRKADQIETNLVKAMKAAITDGARERIEQARQELLGADILQTGGGAGSLAGSRSILTVLRLDPEDIGVRPLPVLGAYGQAGVGELDAAPRASQEGAFGAFTISGQGSSWVCLPQWKALAMAQHPVALSLMDCSAVSPVVQALKCKTEEDKRRLKGSGLLVADKGQDVMRDLDVSAFYLAASNDASSGGSPHLQIVDGAMIQEGSYVGLAKIVFVARPPLREMGMGEQARTSSEDSLVQI